MDYRELEWLATRARNKKFIAEIGSWMGRSTTVLARHTTGRVLAVDTWKGLPEINDMVEWTDNPDPIFTNWVYYTHHYPNIIHCRMESVSAAKRLSEYGIVIDGQIISMPAFDMVFIDGDHSYESVRDDILAWLPCVVDGGILCGHDFHHPPVRQAVTEFFGPQFAIDNPDTRIWEVEVRWEKRQ